MNFPLANPYLILLIIALERCLNGSTAFANTAKLTTGIQGGYLAFANGSHFDETVGLGSFLSCHLEYKLSERLQPGWRSMAIGSKSQEYHTYSLATGPSFAGPLPFQLKLEGFVGWFRASKNDVQKEQLPISSNGFISTLAISRRIELSDRVALAWSGIRGVQSSIKSVRPQSAMAASKVSGERSLALFEEPSTKRRFAKGNKLNHFQGFGIALYMKM